MPAPEPRADGVLQVRILFDGVAEEPAQAQLIRAQVRRAVNRLPEATLEFDDGDPAAQDFPLAGSRRMAPGPAIRLEAGYGDELEVLFQGVIATLGLTIGADGARLVLECRDRAGAMAQGLRSTSHAGRADAEIMRSLIEAHGLQADVQGAQQQLEQRSQIRCSDWDYLLALAQANACVVRVRDGHVHVGPADTGDAPVLSLVCGSSMIGFDAQLGSAGPAGRASLQGSVRFEGSARAALAAGLELDGLGDRFNGPVRITGLSHTLAEGGWITEAQFGAADIATRATASAAGGPLPALHGLQIGTVTAVHGDPQGEHRVRLRLPAAGIDALWARLAQPQAGAGFGTRFVPEPGDEVVVGCFDDDPQQPVVLGSLYGSRRLPPEPLRAEGRGTALVTRGGSRLEFDDQHRLVTLTTPAHNRLAFSDEERSVRLADQHGNEIVLSAAGVLLDSRGDIQLRAQGRIGLQAHAGIELAAGADLKLTGLNVNCSAAVGLMAQGQVSAELSAGGQTTVKGALVMIN